MFITFCQNNSGGYFIQNENVDEYVIIEGTDLKDILIRANEVFEDYREFCPCCGERWDDDYIDADDLDCKPMIDDKSVYDYKEGYSSESKAIIYYIDGTKEMVKTR